jgi:DNA-binding transcriptional LysR family regulator
MNLKAIRLFFHVMQRGSLTAAADELHMSQSAASRLLAGLEHATGLKLFSREGQRLRPTAEGEQYFQECHRVLAAIDELPRTARRLASGSRPRLRLVTQPRLVGLMVPAIGRLLKKDANIEIDLQLVWRNEFERLITFEQPLSPVIAFDVGIVVLPLKNPSVEVTPLFDMPSVAIMRPGHPLARKAFVRAADLAPHPLIMSPVGSPYFQVREMFAAEGLSLRLQHTATSIDLACRLAMHSDAIAIGDPLVPLTLGADDFAVVPIKPPRTVRVALFTPALQLESRQTALLKTCLREEVDAILKRLAQRDSAGLRTPQSARGARQAGPARRRKISTKAR